MAAAVEERLVADGRPAYRLDGDNLRYGLNSDLGFDRAGRDENVRRVAEVAKLFAEAGVVAVVALISPYAEARRLARELHEAAGIAFIEVYVATPVAVCASRDPKGLYARARTGASASFTGVDDPYEVPDAPELVIDGNAPVDGLRRSSSCLGAPATTSERWTSPGESAAQSGAPYRWAGSGEPRQTPDSAGVISRHHNW